MLYSNTSIGFNGHINETAIDGFVHQIVLYLAFKYNFTYRPSKYLHHNSFQLITF